MQATITLLLVCVAVIAHGLSLGSRSASKAARSASNIALNAKSASVPFLEAPAALDGSMAGDVGFDPMGFTNAWTDKDWSQQVVPDIWPGQEERTTPVTTLQWMREAELKHGRVSMLAIVGWFVVDAGVRFPGSMFASITNSFGAHDAAVRNGSMGVLLFCILFLELAGGAAIYDQAKGSGRAPGDFAFDPFKLSANPVKRKKYAQAEIKNGRLAMLAISGILTQSAAFPDKGLLF